ncbi:unnamed protein product [Triticum turgidum subsp. durum]|uniref:Uncharacterized protein n=1 Tax=Triticum turgidum subsp. durum TaxID=4567 RepID=A0A9R1NHK4_TRITD|nr:unnamed protein product [Triticum turgidum subsp. durum]
MPGLEDIRIQAQNIDAAVEEIISVLEDTSKGNVIYFHGWRRLGASAALKVVAQRLKSSKSKFDKVIHVDCFVWKSMRALQKAVAEELELPLSVMAIFDRCDEDDDFNGIEQGSRGVIEDISREICRKLLNSRFVLFFLNGSRRYIDFYECGVPTIPLLGNKVLWTWHGRFRLDLVLDDGEPEKMMMQTNVYLKMMMQTNVYLRTSHGYVSEQFCNLVHEEAEEVATCTRIAKPGYMNHKVVKQCVLYALYGWAQIIFSPTGLVDLDTHGPNYWICDGIIQVQGNTSAWEIGNSLQRNISLDWVRKNPEGTRYLAELITGNSNVDDDRWVYVTHKDLLQDDTGVLRPGVTSFFVLPDEPPINTIPVLQPSLFQHSRNSKLRVLHLSRCRFSFASPPFLCCSQLRLLHLDQCTNMTGDDEHPSYNENISCFQKLWVLELRYTHWYWLLSEKMKRLMVELRELNVEGVKHGSISDLCGGIPSLVILRVTEASVPTENEDTNNEAQFPNMSNTNSLTTSSFINNVLPPRLESFSFINKAETAAKISSISFRGCSRLKSILLRGNLGSLEELDLSGTAVKTLDLRE